VSNGGLRGTCELEAVRDAFLGGRNSEQIDRVPVGSFVDRNRARTAARSKLVKSAKGRNLRRDTKPWRRVEIAPQCPTFGGCFAMTQTGFFLIADVTGYTAFLTQSELEHAQGILEGLFEALLENLETPLVLSNFEGDAILCYAPDSAVVQGHAILEAAENLYCAFADALGTMERNTTCPCNACTKIPDLDLKLVIHHGEFVLQKMGDRRELTGPDVILTHRLLKNDVAAATGIKAYALVTEQAVAAMKADDYFADLPSQTEEHEHIGGTKYYIHSLEPVWERRRLQQRRFVGPNDPLWILPAEFELPVSLSRAWAYITEPAYRQRWLHSDKVIAGGQDKGRTGVGTVHHCVHGKRTTSFYIVDWHPFDYLTYELPLTLGYICRLTTEFTPVEGGTRITFREIVVFSGGGTFRRIFGGLVMATVGKRFRNKILVRELAGLADIAREEAEAGLVEYVASAQATKEDVRIAARSGLPSGSAA